MTKMTQAYDVAAAAVRQRLREQAPEALRVLEKITKKAIVVYPGTYDSVEKVLHRLSVNYTKGAARVRAPKLHFANCASNRNSGLEKIARKVENGAWLVTTDWALTYVVAPSFPNTIRQLRGKSTSDEVVAVEPSANSLWQDVVLLGTDPQWWLEGGSHAIEVLDRENVQVEAASHEMLQKYQAPIVGARFDWGDGHVYHVISHLWLKRSRTPNARYQRSATDFLELGMRLSPEGIERVLKETNSEKAQIDFASIQSAVTSTELVAQLCVQACA